jgi:hypothetical protein
MSWGSIVVHLKSGLQNLFDNASAVFFVVVQNLDVTFTCQRALNLVNWTFQLLHEFAACEILTSILFRGMVWRDK